MNDNLAWAVTNIFCKKLFQLFSQTYFSGKFQFVKNHPKIGTNQRTTRAIKLEMKISLKDSSVQETLEKEGIKPDTKKKKDVSEKLFQDFLKSKDKGPMEDLFTPESRNDLEALIMAFFDSLRTNKGQLPSRAYFESVKSGLKMRILELTHDEIDISNMKLLSQMTKGMYKKLKEAGKGDVKSHPRLPDAVLDKIFQAFGDLTKFLETKDSLYLNSLPKVYQDHPVRLLQHSVVFSIIILDVRRGREGLADLSKDSYSLCHQEGLQFFKKSRGEGSKNHQSDSEDLGNNGIISFAQGSHGFNPGLLLSFHLEHLNSGCNLMFQKPKNLGPLELFHEEEWYFNMNVGKNPLGNFLPQLTKDLKLPHFTNHSLRTSAIEILKLNGYSDREIMKLSGHKRIDSLNHYNPGTTLAQKNSMAHALISYGPRKTATSLSSATSSSSSSTTSCPVRDSTAANVGTNVLLEKKCLQKNLTPHNCI